MWRGRGQGRWVLSFIVPCLLTRKGGKWKQSQREKNGETDIDREMERGGQKGTERQRERRSSDVRTGGFYQLEVRTLCSTASSQGCGGSPGDPGHTVLP